MEKIKENKTKTNPTRIAKSRRKIEKEEQGKEGALQPTKEIKLLIVDHNR